MRNKVDFTLPLDSLFLNPWQDSGLSLIGVPDFLWRPMGPALIEGFAASADDKVNAQITAFTTQTRQHRKFKEVLEYNSVPVLLEEASFRKSHLLVGEKLLLSGASATRARNAYRNENRGDNVDPEQDLVAYFDACQQGNIGSGVPVLDAVPDEPIDFAVECRNTFNFYHFITESLSQLVVLDQLDFEGNIYFHYPNADHKVRGFAQDFVDALFPEYAGRVYFERAPKEYSRVLTAYDLIGAHYQSPDSGYDAIDALALSDRLWRGRSATAGSQAILAMNSVNTNLIKLRKRALRAVGEMDCSHLPKRFYVGRDTRQSRNRHMQGEDLLFDHLKLFGFEYVVFENLSQTEQIALMANAEMMISYHGAGFTNMLFAHPDAFVVEIGTLQTAVSRWGDFWPLANAAQCKYVTFFADYKTDAESDSVHIFRDDILPVHLSERGIGQVMAFVVSVFGHVPQLPTREDVLRLGRQILSVGLVDQTLAVLDAHAEMVRWDVELCLLRANCHKHLDAPKSELVALDQAFKADPGRWQTLVRMIWCANRCQRPQVIRWALARLQADFPDRHDAFVGNHEWVKYVA